MSIINPFEKISEWLSQTSRMNDKLDQLIQLQGQLLNAIGGIDVRPQVRVFGTTSTQADTTLNLTDLESAKLQRFGESYFLQANSGTVGAGSSGSVTFSTIPSEHYFLCDYIGFDGLVNKLTVTCQNIDFLSMSSILITSALVNVALKIEPVPIFRNNSKFTVFNADVGGQVLYITCVGKLLTKEEYKKYQELVARCILRR